MEDMGLEEEEEEEEIAVRNDAMTIFRGHSGIHVYSDRIKFYEICTNSCNFSPQGQCSQCPCTLVTT